MTYSPFAWPTMLGDLTLASWGTIMHRTSMMENGSRTIGEYQRMGTEKLVAMQSAGIALAPGQGHVAAMQPFLRKARANARRLRA